MKGRKRKYLALTLFLYLMFDDVQIVLLCYCYKTSRFQDLNMKYGKFYTLENYIQLKQKAASNLGLQHHNPLEGFGGAVVVVSLKSSD